MPFFRPMLKPTLWLIAGLAILLSLGFWQVQRLHWKLGLLSEIHTHMAGKALSLQQVLALPVDARPYRRVVLHGTFDNAKETYAYGVGDAGPVYHVMTPLIFSDGRAIIIDRGIVPAELRDPGTRPTGQLKGPREIVGIWRNPDPPATFSPKPNLQQRLWFARDVTAMAKLDGVRLVAPVIVEATANPPNPGGWPKGGQTVVDLPNNHLDYAATWFGLAGALVLIYFSYHVSMGRLGWRDRGSA